MRWIWIDKFTEFTSRSSATAIKNVSLAEEHLHDLYPAFPIVPHSLIVEGMAQTAGISMLKSKMPHSDFSEFERDPKLDNMSKLFTVNAIVNYVQQKLEQPAAA